MTELRTYYEQMLHNALLITEMSMDLKERAQAGEKYVCYLRSLAVRASRAISAIRSSTKTFMHLSQRLASNALRSLETTTIDSNLQSVRQGYERLIAILEKELDFDDTDSPDIGPGNDPNSSTSAGIAERLRNLEAKLRFPEQNYCLPAAGNARSFRGSEVDEKYPENWSRESLIDLSNVINLPPVPEDIFTSFAKPSRTSSLSSLKSIRKVKLYLQRAVTSEDEESECDDHEMSISDEPTSGSEGGETRSTSMQIKKGGALCNIKEESLQEP